ncbi:MAG: ATP-binding protein, partial [Planctomycetes bacterium]|nr:ATP-binding protein [Planctomycetota bacterium]
MLLISAKVGPFKSINVPQDVMIDDAVTVLVGMNEAGKTVFLQSLEKSNDAMGLASFNPVEDYPRKDLVAYQKRHKIKPEEVTVLTYSLNGEEIVELNDELHTKLKPNFQFSVTHNYGNSITMCFSVDEKPVISSLLVGSTLSSDAKTAIKKATSLRAIPEMLKDTNLTEEDNAFLATIKTRIAKAEWSSFVKWEAWEWLESRIPKFLYFSEYDLLPSKMNLVDLAQR